MTRWTEIVGAEIAARSEPIKIQWPRPADGEEREPGTLVLRVEGPAAIEIQHPANVICERVNRFLGWRAVGRIALRQAPLRRGDAQDRRGRRSRRGRADRRDACRTSPTTTCRQALARLGAAVKRALTRAAARSTDRDRSGRSALGAIGVLMPHSGG